MLAFVLKKNYKDFLYIKKFDDLEGILNILPDKMQSDYRMAKEFADFVYGMQLRYNIILSQGKDDYVNKEWELWEATMEDHAKIDLQEIVFERLKVSNGSLIKFLFDCKNAVLNNDISKLDGLIIMRERKLKGDKRSKLYNVSEFEYKGWVGIDKLQYRLINAQNILDDIFEGLGGENA